MDIQSLETFIKTAELLHFGRASRACHRSPSALTRIIQRLEEELGAPLFLRDNRTVSLTKEGNEFLSYARNTVREWDRFKEAIASGPEISGALSIYASITAVYSLLPDLLERYRALHPSVQLALRTGAAEAAVEQVLSEQIDLAVAALPERKPERLAFLPLANTPLVFIAPRKQQKADLSKDPLILPQSGSARRRLDRWLKREGIIPSVSSEVDGNEALIAMVRLGGGVGVVPQLALDRSPFRKEVHIIPDAPELGPYVVGLCAEKRSLQRPVVKVMWELAKTLGDYSS